MIEEGILGECLRCSSSLGGLRISPLTPKYVLPRTTLLHSWTPQVAARCYPNDESVGANPEPPVMRIHNLPQTFKTNNSQNGSTVGCFIVIPCFLIHVERLLWSHFFSHSKNHGRPPARMACENWEETDPAFCFECSRTPRAAVTHPKADGTEPLLGSPQFNYEPFNSNSVNIRFWSWNYRGCWHQTCPPIDTRYWMALNIPHCNFRTPYGIRKAYFFSLPQQFFCHWAICAPAALRRSGSYFSGSLSGIEP